MSRQTVEVFHELLKRGWIDRQEDALFWSYAEDPDVQEELEDFKAVMGCDLVRAGTRLYLIPTQDNDLFLKNNMDFRRDIRQDKTIRNRDLYLMNYMSVYMIYLFFGGEGNDPQCREFISKEDFIMQFTEQCKLTEHTDLSAEDEIPDYSDNFIQLSKAWLSKLDGEPDSQKFDCKYGILNRILAKYKIDEIFDVSNDGLIRPTRKLKDLMPYFLRKDRIVQIQNWIREGQENAENK